MNTEKQVIINHEKVIIEISIFEDRRIADSITSLYHYCRLNSLSKILETQSLEFNCVSNYDNPVNEYERLNIDSEFWGLVYIACLSTKCNSYVFEYYRYNHL